MTKLELEQFDRWWIEWPKKVSKGAAEPAFVKALKLIGFNELLAATIRFAESEFVKSRRGTPDWKFVKHPASWLNKKCWGDEVEAKPKGSAYHEHLKKQAEECFRERAQYLFDSGFEVPEHLRRYLTQPATNESERDSNEIAAD